jgi:hypothetical protein
MIMPCNEWEKIQDFWTGDMEEQDRRACKRHLKECASCRERLRALREVEATLKTREEMAVPGDLEMRIRKSIPGKVRVSRRLPVLKPFLEIPGRRRVLGWAGALVCVFLLGLGSGKLLFDRESGSGPLARIDRTSLTADPQRFLRNYFLSVETLFLDLSNMEDPEHWNAEEWAMEVDLAREMLHRTREIQLSRLVEDVQMIRLLNDIRSVLEEMTGSYTLDRTTLTRNVREAIDNRHLLMKINGFMS